MNKRSIKYKDTWAAPGSQLHAALEDGNTKLAEQIYQKCEKEYRKYHPKPRTYTDDDLPELLDERQALLDKLFAKTINESEKVRLEKVRSILDELFDKRYGVKDDHPD